jgi:Tfp pilus assembly protein PilF
MDEKNKLIDKILEIDENDIFTLQIKAVLLTKENKIEEAFEIYKKLLSNENFTPTVTLLNEACNF